MNLKKLSELIKLVERSEIAELEITRIFGRKVRISKFAAPQKTNTPGAPNPIIVEENKPTADTPKAELKKEAAKRNTVSISSPMPGTFYRAPAPDAAPYVEIGDTIKPGQVVCIIEAMKLMNELESEVAGKVVEIRVKNEQPVEFGQELFLIEPV
jgi:acetyl-CoA carboxylase biotin carboxyl carrier protein